MNKVEKFFDILLPVLFGVLFFLWWEKGGVHLMMHLRKFQLPVPSEILTTFFEEYDVILRHSLVTVAEALIGLVLGSSMGFMIAVIATLFPVWGIGGLTLISAFNAIPIIALAPVMNNWFGMGMGSKIAIVTVFTMAAMAINAYRGFNVFKAFSLDLMKSYAATKKEIFFYLRLPNAVPNILTALKISTTSSMIAAICSEFFSSFAGIGFELSTALKQAQMARAWAYIGTAAFFGITMYTLIILVERYAIKWHASQR